MTKKNSESVPAIKSDADLTVQDITDILEDLYKKLTTQEIDFIRNYLSTNSIHESAIAAGYAETVATSHIYQILKREHISSTIRYEKLRLYRSLKISDELLLQKLAVIANSNLANYIKIETDDVLVGYGKKGKEKFMSVTNLTVKDTKDIPFEIMAAVKSIKQTKNGIELVLHDMPAAVNKLAEYSGLFKSGESGDLISKVLSGIVNEGIELSLKITKKMNKEVEEAEVVD